jgi:diguanylate cyclase (GGDEF)-like protein
VLPPGVTVVREVGRGAHGVVYRVRRGGRDWAMKVFTDPVGDEGAALVALRREAALLAWVGHAGLPQVHEVGQVGDQFYLIMDLVEGTELSAVLAGGTLPVAQVVELGAQVGEILAAVHPVGRVHRDVKPHNIMIEPAGGVRLIDFGTAAWAGDQKADLVAGTLLYCAPEQSGMIKRPVDARSDLYSLGVVLFEALAGHPPFVSDEVAELLRMHVVTVPPRLDEQRPEVPAALADIVARLLAKDPDDRYQTSMSLVADLRALAADPAAVGAPAAVADDEAGHSGLAPLIGREAERTRLTARWQRARDGHGGVAVVSGGPGLGKTRLMEELAQLVRRQGRPVLWADCDGDAGPLSAIRAAVEHHLARLRRLPRQPRDVAIQQVREAAGPAAVLLRRLSPVLAGMLTDDGPELSREANPDVLTSAAATFLAELARVSGGALLCLDGAPAADEATQAVLRQLGTGLADAPLLVVLSTPEAADGQRPATLVEQADCVLPLARFGADAVAELVAAVARGLAVDADLAESLVARCGTTPFEVQEYVRAVVDAGLLTPHWGTIRLDLPGLDALALPADVFELILRRVDGVGPRCRELLTVGAAIGLRFDAELAARAGDLDDAAELFDQAAARMVVQYGDGELRFVHDGIRQALLGALDGPARRRLHQRIADVLHEAGSTDPAYVHALGRHCLHGEPDRDPSRSLAALVTAGRQALADCAPTDAVELLEQAGRLVDRVPGVDGLEVGEQLGLAYYRAGRFTDALATLEDTLAATTDPVDRARLFRWLHDANLGTGNLEASLAAARLGLAELGRRLPAHPLSLVASSLVWFGAGLIVERFGLSTADPARHARYELEGILLGCMSSDQLMALNPLPSVALNLRALYALARLGICSEYVRIRAQLGAVALAVGLPSHTAFRRAEEAAATLGDPETATWVSWLQRVCVAFFNDNRRTLAAEIIDRTGMVTAAAQLSVLTRGIWMLLGAGYVRSAQTLRDYAVALLSVADVAGHELTLCGIAIASAQGRISDADAMMLRIEDQPDAYGDPSRRLSRLLAEAVAAVEQQDVGPTFDRIAADFAALRIHPRSLMQPARTIYPVLAYGRLGQLGSAPPDRRAAALAAAESAVQALGAAASGPVAKTQHRIAEAYLRHLSGDHLGALAGLARAEHRSGDLDAPSVSFEAARLRARALTALGRSSDATVAAVGALTLAEMHGWPHRAQWIRTEFPALRPAGSHLTGGTGQLSHGPSQAAHRQLLAALEQMTTAASGILDPRQLTRVALDEIIRLLHAERAFMFRTGDDGRLLPHLGRDAAGDDLTVLTDYGSTLVERVRQSGEPLVVTGTDEGEALGSQSVVAYGLRSIMVAPLLFDGRLLGVVYLDSRVAKGIFTTADTGILTALTTHVAAALETARTAQLAVAAEAIRRERDLAETLRAAMAHLSATLDPADVLRRLHAIAARVLPADRSWLAVLDGDKIHVYAGDEHADATTTPLGTDPALHELLAATEPVLGAPGTAPPLIDEEGPLWMAIPLRVRDTAVGLLLLTSEQPAGYGPAHADLAGVLANQGMTAYDNARLFTQAEQLATTDVLTGLANRRHFFATALRGLALAHRQRSELAAVMLDIDHFKQVNDVHGHHVGDQVIRAVAQRLAHSARTTDILGRYGGEEFALILPDIGTEGASVLAERLRAAVADCPIDTDAGPLTVTVSIGVAPQTAEQTDVETLLSVADAALYRAKRAGRNRVVVADGPGGSGETGAGDAPAG